MLHFHNNIPLFVWFLQNVTDVFTLFFLFLYQLTLCEICVLMGVFDH